MPDTRSLGRAAGLIAIALGALLAGFGLVTSDWEWIFAGAVIATTAYVAQTWFGQMITGVHLRSRGPRR